MESGRLRNKVTVQREKTVAEGATVGDDGHIDLTEDGNWTTYTSRFFEIQEGAGREFEQARQNNADVSIAFVTRFDKVISQTTSKMRATWTDNVTGQTRTAEIESVISKRPKGGAREKVVIACKEMVS